MGIELCCKALLGRSVPPNTAFLKRRALRVMQPTADHAAADAKGVGQHRTARRSGISDFRLLMMLREIGNKGFPIWLLGDSNPKRWQDSLKTPLDLRHPIRHNIWTSVLDVIQDKVYRESRSRIDSSAVYIRNAVDDPAKKPSQATIEWGSTTQLEVEAFRRLTHMYKPALVLCFGAFAFEFARRTLEESPLRGHGYWGAKKLGEEFRRRVAQFNPEVTNALPLLHRSIAGGKFIGSHDYFCGEKGANYFEQVGEGIASILLRHRELLQVWVV